MSAEVEIKNTIGLQVLGCTAVQNGTSFTYTYSISLEWPNDLIPPPALNTNLTVEMRKDNNPAGIEHYELFCSYTDGALPTEMPEPGTTTPLEFSLPGGPLDVDLIGKSAAVTFTGTNPTEVKAKKAKKDGILRQPPVPTK